MKGGNLKNWLTSMEDKIKNKPFKELEEVDPLRTKPKLMSKTTAAANKAAKVNHKGTANLASATQTTAASRKTKILFADQQKEKTWKYKVVLSWTIIVKYKETVPPKKFWRRH